MPDKIDFSLPQAKKKISLGTIIIILLGIAIFVGLLNAIFLIIGGPAGTFIRNKLTPDQQKELAMRLQNNGLTQAAIDAWNEYLNLVNVDSNQRASIYYSIGKMYQEIGEYENALMNYYLSESTFKRVDLEQDISLRIQESLESLGKYAALRQELSQRTAVDQSKADQDVLAEIGPEKITMADLDKKIEQVIDLQLSQYAAFLDANTLNKQKEELFKQYSGEEGRMNMLNQYIVEELLYRKAIKEGISKDDKIKDIIKALQKQLLAQSYINKQKAENIKLTESDLKNYYEANRGNYIKDGIQKNFEEVKEEASKALWAEKTKAVEQNIIQGLKDEYNVVIHFSKLKQGDESTK